MQDFGIEELTTAIEQLVDGVEVTEQDFDAEEIRVQCGPIESLYVGLDFDGESVGWTASAYYGTSTEETSSFGGVLYPDEKRGLGELLHDVAEWAAGATRRSLA